MDEGSTYMPHPLEAKPYGYACDVVYHADIGVVVLSTVESCDEEIG